jgi:putative redox protein
MAYEALVTWKEGTHLEGESAGQFVQMDAVHPDGSLQQGVSPLRLLLIALGGCTAMDVVSLFKKMRQDVTHLDVVVKGERGEEHPKVFTKLELIYRVRGRNLSRELIEKAVNLSEEKYCSVAGMLKKAAPISISIEITEEEMAPAGVV